MRRIGLSALLLTAVLLLCGCQRVINTPSDEIVLYRWQSEMDNGNTVSLTFDDDTAVLTAQNDSFTLSVSGYCAVYDDRFIISDSDTQDNYTFLYRLYGDRVEVTCGGGTISLNKVRE